MKLTPVKKMVITAVFSALCVVLPMIFHAFPNGGNIFLPMHIPVLLCGLICSWPYGFVCGIIGPLLSSLLTGMPPAAFLPIMMVECAVYGCTAGAMMRLIFTKKVIADLYISMGTAMVLGRVIAGFAKAYIFTPGISPFAWVTTSLVQGIPGICIQLVLIPLLVASLMRAKLLPQRYQQGAACE